VGWKGARRSKCTNGINNTTLSELFPQPGYPEDPFPTVTEFSYAFQLVRAEKSGWEKVPYGRPK